ncbi:hypothetical protein PVK06_006995 [Gossypium arboreum]|uniref:Reverse transcriptase n=1 Tax=Gossypium arboreum TaxID=29729 RepID=A0ABR0QH66_GOSAR|nr:hypothetical protein PVK06_006995 [Gossypium arboreum]
METKLGNRQMEQVRRKCGFVHGLEVDLEGYSGRWFAWERGNLSKTNIRERLDRGVANTRWISMFSEDEDNKQLTINYTKEEIEVVVFEMGPTKALGEDELPGLFYQKCWPIIGNKVTRFYQRLLDMESAFVSGRLISDNVLLAYEILNKLK